MRKYQHTQYIIIIHPNINIGRNVIAKKPSVVQHFIAQIKM